MKKLLLIAVVAALALTLVPLAVAAGHNGKAMKHAKGKAKFNLVGMVTAPLNSEAANAEVAGELGIKVKAGTKSIRALRGNDSTFVLAAGAKIRLLTAEGCVVGDPVNIEAGDWVKATGKIKTVDGEKVYTITSLKYRDLTPVVELAPELPAAPVAQ